MMGLSVYVVATGARTPVGLRGPSSVAAVRAGISAVVEHPLFLDHLGDPVMGAIDAIIDPVMKGADRLIALLEPALLEACEALAVGAAAGLGPISLYLATAEPRPGFTDRDVALLRNLLERRLDSRRFSRVTVFAQGHAAGFAALETAIGDLRRGSAQVAVVGGVDSYFHPHTIEWLDKHRQLAGADARSAFVPGEGAGFVVIAGEAILTRYQLPKLAQLISVATAMETNVIKTPKVCLGEGLTEAVRSAVASLRLPSDRVGKVICDINGERYRGEEWGFTCLRLAEYFVDPTAYDAPGSSWGDVGAASMPLFALLALEASQSERVEAGMAMLWASSEAGLRGAAVFDRRFQN